MEIHLWPYLPFLGTLMILKGRIVSERGDNSFKMRCDTLWHSVTPAFVSWGQISLSLSLPPRSLAAFFLVTTVWICRRSLPLAATLFQQSVSWAGGIVVMVVALADDDLEGLDGQPPHQGGIHQHSCSMWGDGRLVQTAPQGNAMHATDINTFAIVKDERVHCWTSRAEIFTRRRNMS